MNVEGVGTTSDRPGESSANKAGRWIAAALAVCVIVWFALTAVHAVFGGHGGKTGKVEDSLRGSLTAQLAATGETIGTVRCVHGDGAQYRCFVTGTYADGTADSAVYAVTCDSSDCVYVPE